MTLLQNQAASNWFYFGRELEVIRLLKYIVYLYAVDVHFGVICLYFAKEWERGKMRVGFMSNQGLRTTMVLLK